jgi:hypothetical protein
VRAAPSSAGQPRRGGGGVTTHIGGSLTHHGCALPALIRLATAVDAFVACGGNADKSGHVQRATLVKIIKVDFGLTIGIEELIDAIDSDGSGEIEYDEFKELLSSAVA